MKQSLLNRRVMASVVLACAASPMSASAQSVLFEEDWQPKPSTTGLKIEGAEGAAVALTPSVRVLNGRADIATRGGRTFLRVGAPRDRWIWTSVDIALPGMLPDDFTIEFDMLVPMSGSYPVEISIPLDTERGGYRGANARSRFVTAVCGTQRTGVYGGHGTTKVVAQPEQAANSFQRCRASVSAKKLAVSFASSEVMVLENVEFGRANRIRLTVPAGEGQEAYIGAIRITGSGAGLTPTPQPKVTTTSIDLRGAVDFFRPQPPLRFNCNPDCFAPNTGALPVVFAVPFTLRDLPPDIASVRAVCSIYGGSPQQLIARAHSVDIATGSLAVDGSGRLHGTATVSFPAEQIGDKSSPKLAAMDKSTPTLGNAQYACELQPGGSKP